MMLRLECQSQSAIVIPDMVKASKVNPKQGVHEEPRLGEQCSSFESCPLSVCFTVPASNTASSALRV